jgi:oxamate amidohydrolase
MTNHVAFSAPHREAAKVGQRVLEQGGTASEAMVAAAAMIAVQYPHMNSLGGDSFWLVSHKGQAPFTIDGCGGAAISADLKLYQSLGTTLPVSGGQAAITMAGTISAWQKALELNGSGVSLQALLTPAIEAARDGIVVTNSLQMASEKTYSRLSELNEFAAVYLNQGEPLQIGEWVKNPQLAKTLERLVSAGLDDFYRGELAQSIARDLANQGSPLTLEDFNRHYALVSDPLSVSTSVGSLYNLGAPTQGVASLLIAAIYDRLAALADSELDHTHLLVEATKQAFLLRDQWVCDEDYLKQPLQELLSEEIIAACVSRVSLAQAAPWPHLAKPGDTVWMGAVDQYGTMVSFIQSVYWEFGSGCLLPGTGIVWNNRALSFSLDETHHNVLAPLKKPFHTLNPAYAELTDGRRMVYGTMGGEGQPQTQACLASRYLYQGFDLQNAIAQPRWLLGRTWGDDTHQLRLESALYDRIGKELEVLGHEVTTVSDCNELMGHAGAVVLFPQGVVNAASDPRSDGIALIGANK